MLQYICKQKTRPLLIVMLPLDEEWNKRRCDKEVKGTRELNSPTDERIDCHKTAVVCLHSNLDRGKLELGHAGCNGKIIIFFDPPTQST